MTPRQSAADQTPTAAWSFSQWPLRRKLAAALIAPVLLAFWLGGLRVKTELDQERTFARAADSTLLLRPVTEFNLAVQRLAASSAPGGQGLKASAGAYDRAVKDVNQALDQSSVSDSVRRRTEEALVLGRGVRQAAGQSGAFSVAIDKSASTAGLVSSIIGDLGLNDVSSVKTLVALQDTIAAQRAMTGQQLNIANKDDASGSLSAIKLVGAETSFVTRLKDEATQANVSDIRQLVNENTARGVYLQQSSMTPDELAVVAGAFERSNTAYGSLLNRQLSEFEASLRAQASEHRTQALVNIALIVLALLASLVIVLALLRSLLVPLRAVRHGALEIARHRLPDAVRRIRDGEEAPAFQPIPVHTKEEVGQLARAVDDLHQQALTLAGEQARLRVQVGHMFETLSRRSTSLIEQQLTLIERLESDEEDPQRLQSLFRLDHLAARMRRNSDSLLVLAGTTTRRGGARSVSVADAVRAAVSEVEEYQRIDMHETSDDHVLSSVGSDLIHMLAEVVDNALSYSPPTSRVTIRGARTSEGGVLIEIKDAGLGMPPNTLAALNERLADGGDITTDTARRMGLFVVGSLAKRHGIGVRLRRNDDVGQSGITVSVHLPGVLLADRPSKKKPAVPLAGQVNGSAAPAAAPVQPNGHTASPSSPAAPPAPPAAPPVTNGEPVRGPGGLPVRRPMASGVGEHTSTGSAPAGPSASGTPAGEATSRAEATARTFKGMTSRRGAVSRPAGADEPARPTPPPATPADSAPAESAPAGKPAAARAAEPAPAPVPEPAAEPVSEGPRTTTGLPMRRPMATGITEHTGTPATRAEAAAEAANDGKRSWLRLPSRRSDGDEPKAKGRGRGKEAAAAEAEAEEEHRMPANLTAWLDHRAKLAEARAKATEDEAAGESADRDQPATDTASEQATEPAVMADTAATVTEPAVAVAEPAEAAEAGQEPAVPSATESAPAPAPVEEQVAALPARAAEPVQEPVYRDAGFSAAAAAMAPTDQPFTPFNAFGTPQPTAAQPVAQVAQEPPAPTEAETLETGLPRRQPGASGISPADSSHEDTPIFRAMGSSWLANTDGGQVDSSWSPAAAAGAPSAGAGIEGTQPESTVTGLPVRRPGQSGAPGTDPAAEGGPTSTRGGRDPESIRRSLNRHQTGVSSARSQTPLNGTPDREEADVPH
ncbi:Signal transduction histidine kinase [Pedococcus cremeus]|uniref:histidine kinase n=1 Tax=Pedococcus cremeus TaxID=587636 RepID=A0A1H9TP89_9MICO|nr:sensor histidine kinase [Pedococcus cremeus]SER98962.1 Signal transduction histidine kinase [Pedococcus cremeus]